MDMDTKIIMNSTAVPKEKSEMDFVWDVSRTELLVAGQNGRYIESPKFRTSTTARDETWNIRVYPKGSERETPEHVSAFLCRQGKNELSATATIFVSNQDESKEHFMKLDKSYFTSRDKCWGFSQFIERATLFDRENGFVKDSKIRIGVRLPMDTVILSDDMHGISSDDVIRTTLNDFRLNGTLTDITLRTSYGVWRAHRAILAVNSHLFRDNENTLPGRFQQVLMVSHDSKNMTDEIIIASEDCKDVGKVVEFMYTNVVSNINDTLAEDLLQCADQFKIDGLTLFCENYFKNEIACDNAISLLMLGDNLKLNELKKHAEYFIIDNATQCDFTENKDWKKFKESPKLLAEIIELSFNISRMGNF